jgi:arginase
MLGVDKGPKVVRHAGLYNRMAQLQMTISEKGDLVFDEPTFTDRVAKREDGRIRNGYAAGRACHKIHQMVDQTLQQAKPQDRTLVIGGDHSVAIGSISAALKHRPDTGVVWVSAHGGFNTPLTTPSANLHGMVLALLSRGVVDHSKLPGFEWLGESRLLEPRQITCIALRELDQAEINMMRSLGVQCFTMHDIDKIGIGEIMDQVIAHHNATDPSTSLHLSFDINAADPLVAPATYTKVPGGLTLREANHVAESLALTGCVRSMDLVEVNPTLASPEEVKVTVDVALGVVCCAMGHTILTLNPDE